MIRGRVDQRWCVNPIFADEPKVLSPPHLHMQAVAPLNAPDRECALGSGLSCTRFLGRALFSAGHAAHTNDTPLAA